MKSGFTPISIADYVEIHLKSNPGDSRSRLTQALKETLQEYKRGEKCHCGNSIWVLGSAFVGNACFICITGEEVPEGDYEIDEACEE